MAKTFSELQALALQIRDEILEKKNTAPRVGAALLDMIDNTIQNITDINQKLSVFEHACSGFKRVESESQLPVTPPEDEKAVGYLVGKNLYLYVGKDGNAVNGRYFNVGDITGPQGETGPQGRAGEKGEKGEQGNSGVSGSTDNIEVVNNLDGGESTPERIKVLAAEQGKVLNGKVSELERSINHESLNRLMGFPYIDNFKPAVRNAISITDRVITILTNVTTSSIDYFNIKSYVDINRSYDNYYMIGKVVANQEVAEDTELYAVFGKDRRLKFVDRICTFELQGATETTDINLGVFNVNAGDTFKIEYLYVIPKEHYYTGIINDIVDGALPSAEKNEVKRLDNSVTLNNNSIAQLDSEVYETVSDQELSIYKEEQGKYVNGVYKYLQDLSAYKLIFYEVEPNTKYIVNTNVSGEYVGIVSIWSSEEVKDSSIIDVLYNSGSPGQGEIDNQIFSTSNDTQYMVLSVRNENSYNVFSVKKVSKIEELENKVGNSLCYCWGDSLTWGSGGVSWNYAKWLNSKQSNIKFISCGVGGDGLPTIAARQGGNAMFLKQDIELPSDTSEIPFGTTSSFYWEATFGGVGLLTQGEGRDVNTVNPVIIDGIECTLRYDSNNYYIKRNNTGKARTLKANTLMILAGAKLKDCFANVYWAGTNGGSFSSIEELTTRLYTMIDYNANGRYVVIGLHSTNNNTPNDIIEINTALKDEFGIRFIDQHRYMVEHGIYDAIDRGYLVGDYPTSEDVEAMEQDKVPPSLLVDTVHYNDIGYKLIGDLIYDRFISMGLL